MNLLHKARALLVTGAVNGIALALMTVLSANFLLRWALDGTVSVWYGVLCGSPVLVGAILSMAPTVLLAALLLPLASSVEARRAAYVLVLLPLVILVFCISSVMDWLIPSMVLGLPLFLVGAFAIPYSASTLHRDLIPLALAHDVARIACSRCGALLPMARDDQVVRCAQCKAPNLNPFMSRSGTLGEPQPWPKPPPPK